MIHSAIVAWLLSLHLLLSHKIIFYAAHKETLILDPRATASKERFDKISINSEANASIFLEMFHQYYTYHNGFRIFNHITKVST